MIGYIIFLACTALLAAICFAVRKGIKKHDINSLVFAGGRIGGATLTFSIFAAWMWTTSIIGASETYALYGIWGPVSYVGGACIAFAGLIAFLSFLRRKLPGSATWLDFVHARYGRRSKHFYYLFAVVIPAYVLIEQGVGIGYILESFYGSSFRILSFFSVVLAMGIVFTGGMKFTLAVENVSAAIILAGFAAGVTAVAAKGTLEYEFAEIVSSQGEGSLARMIASALRYFIMAIVIAFGQIVFDPAWYLKASLAGSARQMIRSGFAGGILLWGITSLIASVYLGWVISTSGQDAADIFAGSGKAVFSVVIVFIGISSIAHYLMGAFGIFTTDLHKMVTGTGGADREKIVFGRVMLIAFGIFCASMTIALESISLLSIDVFCAIFFAAPCVPLVLGCLTQRDFGRLPIIASAAGIICGLVLWGVSPGDPLHTQFIGMTASMAVPLIIMMPGFIRKIPCDR